MYKILQYHFTICEKCEILNKQFYHNYSVKN